MTPSEISAFMAEMGRRGGKVGGKRCLETMTSAERSARASHAARVRWRHPQVDWWRRSGAAFTQFYPDEAFLGVVDHLTDKRVWYRAIAYDSLDEKASRRMPIPEFAQLVKRRIIVPR